MSEWQPIETAPKDGTAFLAFEPSEDDDPPRIGVCYISTSGDLIENVSAGFADDYSFAPTHWMPLPEPPA